MCKFIGISRSSYYKWLNRKESANERLNKELLLIIAKFYHERKGILGYRQMTMKINKETKFHVNHKRIYRLMDIINLKSVCRKKKRRYKKTSAEITAENILNRDFKSNKFGEKWLTDVTEFKYGTNKKAYLSAILDLSDKSIVSYVLGKSNNNPLVFETFDKAIEKYPGLNPIFHSDRGYQYTSKMFSKKLDEAKMKQSMSRPGKCIDNGPMECFWGILKTEMYHLERFDTYEELENSIKEYINYYDSARYQKRLKSMTPIEYRKYLRINEPN